MGRTKAPALGLPGWLMIAAILSLTGCGGGGSPSSNGGEANIASAQSAADDTKLINVASFQITANGDGLTLTPASGLVGTEVLVSGTEFPESCGVEIRTDTEDGPVLGTADVTEGSFEATVTIS